MFRALLLFAAIASPLPAVEHLNLNLRSQVKQSDGSFKPVEKTMVFNRMARLDIPSEKATAFQDP